MPNNTTAFSIAELIYKSIAQTISTKERLILDKWLTDKNNKDLYLKITNQKNIQHKLTIYQQLNVPQKYNDFEQKLALKNKQEEKISIVSIFKYAAILLVIIGTGFLIKTQVFKTNNIRLDNQNNITLQLENGSIKVLKETDTITLKDTKGNIIGAQQGNQITYNTEVATIENTFNTLNVPNGKRLNLVLSDGTQVYLNSGSSIKYPSRFLKGEHRKVFLKGEAFFKVTEDKDAPFIVNSEALNIQVLGTHFNVSNFPEDQATDVVLVSGSVNLYAAKQPSNQLLLKPGFKGSYNKEITQLSSKKVNTNMYTSWVDGELVFRNITFSTMLKKLERRYNVTIANNNKVFTNEKFNASFRNEPIEKILEYFKINYKLQYTIEKNNIIIY